MSLWPSPRTARWIGWPACFTLVFISAFSLSGTRPPRLDLDPSWQVALEYAETHRLQFGTQIVFTFGPLGFLSAPTSLGHLVGARVAFAFLWSGIVALAATSLAKRLTGWIRYGFLAWLVVFTLSEGLDQTGFFVMASGAMLLLSDNPKHRWQAPGYGLALIILSLIKGSFLTAGIVSLGLVTVCLIWQRKIRDAIVLAVTILAAFAASWMALGQSMSHLAPWFRHGWELQSGYSAAMNLVPKTPVFYSALGALALFVVAFFATIARTRGGTTTWGILITIVQYVFLAWKEGFTRSGDWHVFVFLWFLPLSLVFCLRDDIAVAPSPSPEWVLKITLWASMALCLIAAHYQISGFAWRQMAGWPGRIGHNTKLVIATLGGRANNAYAGCRDASQDAMLRLDRAKDVIGTQSVDVMNYLALAAVVNRMNYRPRPVFQGFVAYTPVLQDLNAAYFRSQDRPRFVLLRQQATDGRFPMTEDSAALDYVLNNYVPVARDGTFLVLQQRSTREPAFEFVHEQTLHFGQSIDLRPWVKGPLFMSVAIHPTLVGQVAALLYQPQPLHMRVSTARGDRRYRLVPSMVERPFLVNPILESNFDVMNLFTAQLGQPAAEVEFERPPHGAFEYQDHLSVRLYNCPDFPGAARRIPVPRMLADVQGEVFWPEPKSLDSAAPARLAILGGTPALVVHAPSRIVLEIPEQAVRFSGYFGIPEEIGSRRGLGPDVTVAIDVQDRSGKGTRKFVRVLQPCSRADDRSRVPFRIPLDSTNERRITLTTTMAPSARGEGGWSIWSLCRFEE